MEWVVTDNIYREAWRRLIEFANIDLALDYIAQRHGGDKLKGNNKANYLKQARQVRVCVLQAKEYFDAARASSVFTRPNHIYYGALSLASMMMLLLGDGTRSLDYLRKDSRNKHHGLDFSTGSTARSAADGLDLIDKSFVKVLDRGHFPNWYAALPPQGVTNAVVTRQDAAGGLMTTLEQVGAFSPPPLQSGVKHSLTNLIKYLPDLSADLYRCSIPTIRSRTTHRVFFPPGGGVRHMWSIHSLPSSAELDSLLNQFSVNPSSTDAISEQRADNGRAAIVTIQWAGTEQPIFKYPSSRDTLNCDTISYADEVDTHEIVDLYLIAYQLSMLSRYYPDLWISCVESQCKAARLVERAIDVVMQKLPILALSFLTPGGLTISTHRAPWHNAL